MPAWRSLPLAIFATALVIALPALLVAVIVPRGGVLLIAVSAISAVALSSAFAAAGAAFWKRRRASRDIVFADLMLWGWLRRCWTERRLTRARELYESARKAGARVDIDLLTTLSGLLQARDRQTHGHGQRVARHAGRIARAMHLSPVEVAKIRTAAVVHDVGKLHTPREILNNPERLTDAEFAVIMRHPAAGALFRFKPGEILAVKHHLARVGFGQADDGFESGRFAHPVPPHQTDQAVIRHLQVHATQDARALNGNGDVGECQHQVCAFFLRPR